MIRKILLFSFICMLTTFVLRAQSTDSVSSPKIGLVLSGGGAKGFAHIGVLKVLEEHGIYPDYISGTSMGAIVGALYAMGYTADEISEINQRLDWSKIFSDNVSLNKIVMEEKYESQRYLFNFKIYDRKIKLPSGLIQGQQLEYLLLDLMWPNYTYQNFDSLTVPFHCVSVDLLSGDIVEFSAGNLVQSVRASISIPSVFTPVLMDSMVLIDGGVARNFPVQEVLDMGADIVIGVNIGFKQEIELEDLSSLSDVLVRSMALGAINDAKIQCDKVDFLISPDLKGMGPSDFSKFQEIEELGKEAAMAQISQIDSFLDSVHIELRNPHCVRIPQKVLIDDFRVEGIHNLSEEYVVGQSLLQAGKYVSKTDLRNAIERLYGTQQFEKITYSLDSLTDTSFVLVFNVREINKISFGFSPYYSNQTQIALMCNVTIRNFLFPASRLLFTGKISENPATRFEFDKFIGKNQRLINYYFVHTYRNNFSYYAQGYDYGDYVFSNGHVGTGLKYSFGLNTQFGVEGVYVYEKIDTKNNLQIIVPESEFASFHVNGHVLAGFYHVNTTDDLYVPTRGRIVNVRGEFNYKPNADLHISNNTVSDKNVNYNSFFTGILDFQWYQSPITALTIHSGVSGGINFNDNDVIGKFFLGGKQADVRLHTKEFDGYNLGEIVASDYAVGFIGARYNVFNSWYLATHASFGYINGFIDEFIDKNKSYFFNQYKLGYTAGITYNSPLGPLQLLVGSNVDDNIARFYLNVGFPF
ncbi:MAG: patatin-like phospholipase family protein [Bacteroidales bacterium]